MTDKVFFDTNVLVYAFDPADIVKQTRASELIRIYGTKGLLTLSTQVLQEFYVVTTKLKRTLLTKELAAEIVADLSEYPLITIERDIIQRAMQRHQSQVFSFWDSLIVEAALSARCSVLFSEDMQHELLIDGKLTIRNPFLSEAV